MYSRIHHACEIAACVHLPDPIMLSAAAMVRSDSDLSVDSDPERSNKALRAIRNVQTEMGLGGKPDAAAARAQITILATDFDMCANNRVTRSNMTLGQTLRNKGWGELIHINPCFMNSYTCDDSMGVLATVIETIRGMDEIQASTVTLHFHLSMQGVVMDSLAWPYSDVGNGAEIRAETQQRLKTVYVDPILEAAKMTARALIININHDPRFIAIASNAGKAVNDRVTAFLAMGSYVALELRVRGCVAIHGSSFWSKMACHLKPSLNCYQMLSWEADGHGDDRQMVHRGWAICEKQLFAEKMVAACFMDPAKVNEWDGNIRGSVVNRREFAEIWEDRGRIDVSMGVSASTWFDDERRQSIESGAQGDSIAEHASVTWQDFDVAMIMPEPYYDQRQYWFKIDKYASDEYRYALGKVYYCRDCRNTHDPNEYARATFRTGGNGYANACIGCAHFDALKNQSFLDGTRQLVEWQRYSLAAAMYAYDNFLQIVNPCDDMVAFLKACAPIAYTDYGKAISHYGGLRIAPLQAVEYAGCGRAKQLAWDRAYGENGD